MNKLDQIQKQEHYMKNKLIIILILFHLILLIFITILNNGFGGGHARYDKFIYFHSMPWGLFSWKLFNNWLIGGIIFPFILDWFVLLIVIKIYINIKNKI